MIETILLWLAETIGWVAVKSWWAGRSKSLEEAAYEAKEREAQVMEAPARNKSDVVIRMRDHESIN